MTFDFRGAALVSAILLAGCGGGGGGGTPAPVTGPQALAITEANAKPVAANALDSAQNTTAARSGTSLLTGVQVEGGGAASTSAFLAMAQLARAAAGVAKAAPALPTAVAINETAACPLGGSMSVTGNMSVMDAMMAGDNLSINASNCAVDVGGMATVMNGAMSISVISGSASSLPFHVVLGMTASGLSVQSGGATVVATGDARLDWSATSTTVQSIAVTGTSMSSRETIGTSVRTTVLQNYAQSVALNGTTVTCSLGASVQTDSTQLGASGGAYTISTPTPVMWNSATGAVTAGTVKVVAGAGSQLLMTIAADGSVALQLDANGDGAFEKTLTSTVTELKALR